VVVVVRRIAQALLAVFYPTPVDRFPLEESMLDVDMSNWLIFRRLDFIPIFRGDIVSQVCGSHRGVDIDASFFSMSSIALGFEIHLQAGARERTSRPPSKPKKAARSWHIRTVGVVPYTNILTFHVDHHYLLFFFLTVPTVSQICCK